MKKVNKVVKAQKLTTLDQSADYQATVRTFQEINKIDNSRNEEPTEKENIEIDGIAISAEWDGYEGCHLAKITRCELRRGESAKGKVWKGILLTLKQEGSEAQCTTLIFMNQLAKAGYKSTSEFLGGLYHFFFVKNEGKEYPTVSPFWTDAEGRQQSDLLVPNDNIDTLEIA
jgi:hypothetical protein